MTFHILAFSTIYVCLSSEKNVNKIKNFSRGSLWNLARTDRLEFRTVPEPWIICFESYLHKLVGLVSVEAVGKTQHIRGSFVQFTHELVEAGMNLVHWIMRCWRCGVGFERIVKTQDLHSVVIYRYVLNSEQLAIKKNKINVRLP